MLLMSWFPYSCFIAGFSTHPSNVSQEWYFKGTSAFSMRVTQWPVTVSLFSMTTYFCDHPASKRELLSFLVRFNAPASTYQGKTKHANRDSRLLHFQNPLLLVPSSWKVFWEAFTIGARNTPQSPVEILAYAGDEGDW